MPFLKLGVPSCCPCQTVGGLEAVLSGRGWQESHTAYIGCWLFLVLATQVLAAAGAGHVRVMTTGASPIAPEVMEFLRICFGATVMEGYGMTETSCTISLTHPDDTVTGHVGPPLPCLEIKLVDIPEMNYTTADQPYPRGEVTPPSRSVPWLSALCQFPCRLLPPPF